MELRHVRYFIAVAEELNFTRAAERLGIAQPPLSLQIKALENELGAPLLRRLPHGAALTAAGAAFLDEARALIRQADRARAIVARTAAGHIGRLRLGLTGSAAFHPLVIESLRRFRERFPDIELALSQHDTDPLFESLSDDTLDAAFVRPGSGANVPASIVRFADERTVAALPAAHPRARNRKLRIAMLSGETLLMFPRRAGPAFYDETIAACHRANFEPRRILEIPQITAMPSFVAAGFGVALVPQSLTAVTLPRLAYVAIDGEAPIASLAFASGSDSVLTANLAAIAAGLRNGAPAREPDRRRRQRP